MSRLRGRLRRDEGMTLVELVVSAAILFVVLTAVLSLITQTLWMNAQAKETNIATNAVNSYVEWVRTLPFEQVANKSTEPSGVIEATSTYNAGYTVSIVPSVTADAAGSHIKDLFLTVRIIPAHGRVRSYTSAVVIRDRTQFFAGTTRSLATDPKVNYVGLTPAEGSVVRGTTVPLELSGVASTGRTLETASIWVDNIQKLRSTVPSGQAEWLIGAQSWSSPTFYWDTTYADGTTIWSPDGLRTIVAYIRDSAGVEVYSSRQFLVDNYPPPAPTTPTHDSAGSMGGRVSWPTVYDGTSPAGAYEAQVMDQGSATPTIDPFDVNTKWVPSTGYSGPSSSFEVSSQPFHRYYLRVRALSSPTSPLYSGWTNISAPFISRPLLTGSYRVLVKNGLFDQIWPTLTCTPPAFALDDTKGVTYEWHRLDRDTSVRDTIMATTLTNTWTPTGFISPSPKPTSIGFYVKVTATPKGYSATGAAETLSSNAAAAPNLLADGTLTTGTW